MGNAYLNQVLAFGLGDERLKLRCCKRVHQAGFRDDEEKNLGAGKNRQLVGLVVRRDR
jgi:hypothetical protein